MTNETPGPESTGAEPAPFGKWAGGKGQLLPQMTAFFPRTFETYFEPFLGGGAAFLHLRPGSAVLGDLNRDLVNAYRSVQKSPESLMEALDRHSVHRTDEKYFYRIRDAVDPANLSPIERAARLIFLNKTCFNGLYRVNSKGKFNVPWGGYKNPRLYDRPTLLADQVMLSGKSIHCASYEKVCNEAGRNDFVYLDPPYHPLSATSKFTAYTRQEFGDQQQRDLAGLFRVLDSRGCKLMLSNSGTPLVRALYRGYRI